MAPVTTERRAAAAIAELPTHLFPRQSTTADTGCSGTNLSAGALAGIVIGTIAGTLLVLWIIRSCFNLGAPIPEREPMYRDIKPRHTHSGHSRRHSRHSGHRRHSSDMSQPPPVVIREHSRHRQQPTHSFGNERGRTYV